jgi:hypothetical protein
VHGRPGRGDAGCGLRAAGSLCKKVHHAVKGKSAATVPPRTATKALNLEPCLLLWIGSTTGWTRSHTRSAPHPCAHPQDIVSSRLWAPQAEPRLLEAAAAPLRAARQQEDGEQPPHGAA